MTNTPPRDVASEPFSIIMQGDGTVTLTVRAAGLTMAKALELGQIVVNAQVFDRLTTRPDYTHQNKMADLTY